MRGGCWKVADAERLWAMDKEFRHFDQQLEQLLTSLLEMSALVESAVRRSITAVVNRNRALAAEVLQDEVRVTRYLRGWIGYFGKCETLSVLEGLEQWFRRRFRSAIWKQFKRGSVRFAELRKRDVGKDLAAKTAGSAHGPWRLADSLALHVALPNAYFDSLGIPRLTADR